MKKRLLTLLLAVSMAFSTGVSAFALEKPSVLKQDLIITPYWTHTDMINVMLNFSGNKAECGAIVYAKSGTTKITATALLKQVTSTGTKTVKSWTNLSATGDTLYFDQSYYVTSGHSYELEVIAKVYRNGSVETVSLTDYGSC